MEAKSMNPFGMRGSREIYCPHYSDCLDVAIKKRWTHWTCSKCGQSFNRDVELEIPINVNHHIAYYEISIKA